MASGETSKTKRASRLGRGLSSLMAKPVAVASAQKTEAVAIDPLAAGGGQAETIVAEPIATESSEAILFLAIEAIQPNRHQPRQHFSEASLRQLATSIRSEGVIQPIIVRPTGHSSAHGAIAYELVAGERRWRAAQLAGLAALPAIVRELDDRQVAEWALIENLQREDLNPMERAEAFHRLTEQFNLSHDQIATRVGVDRSTVSNLLRLLNLDKDVRQMVRDGLLSMGQARALASLTDGKLQRALASQAIRQEWSVRKLEQAVRQAGSATSIDAAPAPAAAGKKAGHLRDLEQQLEEQLGTKVHIRPGRKKGSGTLAIDFYSLDQFDQILSRLGVEAE